MTISSIAVILLAVATEYGAINVDTIRNAASDLGYTLSYYTEQRIIAMGNDITPEIRLSLLELIDSLINTLPGTVVATAFTVSYICQSMSLAASEKIGENVSQRNYMSASLVTSLVFIGAYLFSFTTNSSGNAALAAVVASNIAFMLTPCLLIVGIKAMRVIPFKLGLLGLLIVIAIVIIMFLPFSSALTVMALTGAFFIVVESIDEWAKEHYSKGENNG